MYSTTNQQLPVMKIRKLLADYSAGYSLIESVLKGLPADVIYFKPDEGKWSIREIIVHMADAEVHAYVMAKKMIAQSGSNVHTYNQKIWADKLFYDKMYYKDAMELIQILRKNLCELLKLIPSKTWQNYIFHPETGKVNLMDWILRCNDHIEIHLQQIRQNYLDWKKLNQLDPANY